MQDDARPTQMTITVELGGGNVLRDLEREAIRHVLALHGGNISRAAVVLGVLRQSLQRKIVKLGLDAPHEFR